MESLCWWEMVSYTGSRKGGWREPGRYERSDVGISHRLAKNKDAGIKGGKVYHTYGLGFLTRVRSPKTRVQEAGDCTEGHNKGRMLFETLLLRSSYLDFKFRMEVQNLRCRS